MNLTSPSQVRRLLESLGVRPSKSLGQNFLIDRNILDILLRSADISPDDQVLEVGPGLGVVTERLATMAQRVVAVEKDHRLYAYLCRRFAGAGNIALISGDMLEIGAADLLSSGLNKVVSNLPYSVGTRILVDLLQAAHAPAVVVATVQREVAERLAAPPGGRAYGLLSVWVQVDYGVETVKHISGTCFWPRPEVSSTIVRLLRRRISGCPQVDRKAFYDLTRHAFSTRRKQIGTILQTLRRAGGEGRTAAAADLARIGIDPKARPENLSVDDWLRLTEWVCGSPGAEGRR